MSPAPFAIFVAVLALRAGAFEGRAASGERPCAYGCEYVVLPDEAGLRRAFCDAGIRDLARSTNVIDLLCGGNYAAGVPCRRCPLYIFLVELWALADYMGVLEETLSPEDSLALTRRAYTAFDAALEGCVAGDAEGGRCLARARQEFDAFASSINPGREEVTFSFPPTSPSSRGGSEAGASR